MRRKKGAVWLYMLFFGLILAIGFYYLYDKIYTDKMQLRNTEIFNQVTQRDIEQSSIKSYLHFSGRLSLIDSIYQLSQRGGFYSDSKCGSISSLPLFETELNSTNDCMPNLKNELNLIVPKNLDNYIRSYPEDLPQDYS